MKKEIRSRFEYLVCKAANHELNDWKKTARGRLALIILVDQFPRNMYRGTSKAFAFDSIAQELTHEGFEREEDQKLFPIERAFFYLPLEHAEDIKLQELSVAKFDELVLHSTSLLTSVFAHYAQYAWRHYEIIKKFGRFPHRNTILGRKSTPEELEFLKGPHSSF